MSTISDLSRYLTSAQVQRTLQAKAQKAAEEATTGISGNKAAYLGGTTLSLSLLDRKAGLLTQHKLAIKEASIFAKTSQAALETIQLKSEQTANDLALTEQIQTVDGIARISAGAADAFRDVVRTLNTRAGDRYLYSGTATDRPPLMSADDMLNQLRASVTGLMSATDVVAALDTWFNAPTGGFETAAYRGSTTGYLSVPLHTDQKATFGMRADDDMIRDILKSLAVASLASDSALSVSLAERKAILQSSYTSLNTASSQLVEERAQVGLTEARISNALTEVDAETARNEAERLSLVGIDQFEAISGFEAAQDQLDVFYRIAARQGRVSLAEYLR